jgi:hypothetical protein
VAVGSDISKEHLYGTDEFVVMIDYGDYEIKDLLPLEGKGAVGDAAYNVRLGSRQPSVCLSVGRPE